MVEAESLTSRLCLEETSSITESEHFMFLPDASPIIEGHSLLITKEHFNSFARIPQHYWYEFMEIKKNAIGFFQNYYQDFFIFEHGSIYDEIPSGICIHHAHIHFIPQKVEVMNWLRDYCLAPIECRKINIFDSLKSVCRDYIYYEDDQGYGCFFDSFCEPLPSQFIRRVVAEELRLSDWDWKKGIDKMGNAKNREQQGLVHDYE